MTGECQLEVVARLAALCAFMHEHAAAGESSFARKGTRRSTSAMRNT